MYFKYLNSPARCWCFLSSDHLFGCSLSRSQMVVSKSLQQKHHVWKWHTDYNVYIYVSKTCFHLCVAVQTFDNWTRQRSEVDMCMGVLGNRKVLSENFFFNLTSFTSKISTGKLYFFQYFIQLSFKWYLNQKQNWKHTHCGRLDIWLLYNKRVKLKRWVSTVLAFGNPVSTEVHPAQRLPDYWCQA